MTPKYGALLDILASCGPTVVAHSGGSDSSLVAYAALQALGPGRVLAATTVSATVPGDEVAFAREFCARHSIPHEAVPVDELGDPDWSSNPVNRCYFCKTLLGRALGGLRERRGFRTLADGTNLSDLSEERPGLRALREQGVRSPLVEAGISKSEVREISRDLGLETWDKPSSPCLASRIPHTIPITATALARVDRAERWLKERFGLRIVRVRDSLGAASVEAGPGEVEPLLGAREEIASALRDLGFTRVTVDPRGYRGRVL
jgi:uncharacterized protein